MPGGRRAGRRGTPMCATSATAVARGRRARAPRSRRRRSRGPRAPLRGGGRRSSSDLRAQHLRGELAAAPPSDHARCGCRRCRGPNGVDAVSPWMTVDVVDVDAELRRRRPGRSWSRASGRATPCSMHVDLAVRLRCGRWRASVAMRAHRDARRLDVEPDADAEQPALAAKLLPARRGTRRSRSSPRPAPASPPAITWS